MLLLRIRKFSGAGRITLLIFSVIGKAFIRLLVVKTIMTGFCPTSAGESGRKGIIEYSGIERSQLQFLAGKF